MNDSVWTPSRDSAGARAFMATLRLHSTDWHWIERAEQARWWVIDAAAGVDLPALLAHYGQLADKPRVAFLTGQLSQLPHPAWTFFKPPVQSGLIFNWVRPHVSAAPTAAAPTAPPAAGLEHPWRQGLLRLGKWPNVSRYGNALELTVACSRLLAAPATYEQVLQWQVPAALLDELLADAHAQGLLQIEPATGPGPAPANASIPPDTPAERSRWDLVKRLLGRFSRP